jgi:tetratricopeptide (TPR) repeat protein
MRYIQLVRQALLIVAAYELLGLVGPRALAWQQQPTADELYLTGRFEEAAAAYQDVDEPSGAIGISRCRSAVGQLTEADRVLEQALARFPESAAIHSERALLALDRGDDEQANRWAESAVQLDPHDLAGWWVQAEVHRHHGRLDEAQDNYRRLARTGPPQEGLRHAEAIIWIARATAQLARWTRKSQDFHSLINVTLPSALRQETNYWPAHLEAANLFAEKFNDAAATDELNAALRINPQAAPVHVARAALALNKFDLPTARRSVERALSLNPNLVEAHQVQADLLLAERRFDQAIDTLNQALPLDPHRESTLGRMAGLVLLSSPAQRGQGEFQRLEQQANSRNPHCGDFYLALADTLDRAQHFPDAARYYRLAIERMPQAVAAHGKLGMVLMRLGDETEAGRVLNESFEIDPFNVRVKNTLSVLDVLQGYAVLETDHFVIKFDRGQDQMLAEMAADFLEREVYPQLVASLGYRPEDKCLLEIFNRSGNTGGHGWFSARMVGLPFVGTVGACAGKMVAITSPNDVPQKFNWARVLKHEFVHVINLQQTNYNVPRWFTEGLAVWHEGYPRSSSWTMLLARRYQANELLDLDSLEYGFTRPGSSEQWTLAYCQAELYIEFLVDRFGQDAIGKMLTAYAQSPDTAEVLQQCFQVDQSSLETEYRKYIGQVLGPRALESAAAGVRDDRSFAQVRADAEQADADPDRMAELAFAYLQRNSAAQARQWALQACQQQPNHSLGSYVLARLYLSIGDTTTARKILLSALDEQSPHEQVLALLAGLHYSAGDYQEALRLYRLGMSSHFDQEKWLKAIAKVHLKTEDDRSLLGVLQELADLDVDNPTICKKLAQLSANANDYPSLARWSRRGLEIDAEDAQLHGWLAQARAAAKDYEGAIRHFQFALQLDPAQSGWRFQLADSCVQARQFDKAKTVLTQLLEMDPDYPGADLLLENLPQ